MVQLKTLQQQAKDLWQSAGLWHGLVMTGSTLLAGVLDYLFNVFSGRLLSPTDYSALIAVLGILQILLHVTNVIRNVVAYYTAEIATRTGSVLAVAPFLRQSFRWSWRWGLVAMTVMALLSPLGARWLQLENPYTLWAGSLALLMLFVRPTTDGTLQGLQHFWGLAGVNVFQASLRLGFALLLIRWGWGAFGAMLSLPMATSSALLLALWFLRPQFQAPKSNDNVPQNVSRRYSGMTLLGLGAFAVMTNGDAILVRGLFSGEIAGNYAPLITLGKINLFVPLAMAMVLFPKAVERHASGRPVLPILLAAMGMAILPGLALTAIFFVAPDLILQFVFGGQYEILGNTMGWLGLATTLFAGISIWLNFALSTGKMGYVWLLVGVVVAQIAGIFLFSQQIIHMVWIMVGAGAIGNIFGLTTILKNVKRKT